MRNLILAALLACGLASAAHAVPVAGQIRVSSISVGQGVGLTITYRLNEAADSVGIELRDAGSNALVASFAGTAAQGANSVVWNGRVDNAAGALVAAGSYRVRVTANKNVPLGWTEFASNRSVGQYGAAATLETLFDGASPRSWLITHNTDSDTFGYLLAISSYATTPPHAGAIVLNPELSVAAGDDGFASRKLKGFGDGTAIINNTVFWDAAVDPNDAARVFATGQAGTGGAANQTGLMTATPLTAENLVEADPFDRAAVLLPRGMAMQSIMGTRYAFLTGGNGVINRVQVNASNEVPDVAPEDILGVSADYSRDVRFDAAGNLYYSSRMAAGGNIYRWNQAQVASATVDSLTPANAVWTISGTATANQILGVTITPTGDVFAMVAAGTERGLYYIGNTASATLTKTLAVADRVVDFTTIGTGWSPSTAGGRVACDIAGNLYACDNGAEVVRGFSPGGNTSIVVVAPTSQTFTVTAANVADWGLY